jgi:hypothetical protein
LVPSRDAAHNSPNCCRATGFSPCNVHSTDQYSSRRRHTPALAFKKS